jgi:hypothetical protein
MIDLDRLCTEHCAHPDLMARVEFDAQAAKGLSAHEVRARWPRVSDHCPQCGDRVICYASSEHYYAGDW